MKLLAIFEMHGVGKLPEIIAHRQAQHQRIGNELADLKAFKGNLRDHNGRYLDPDVRQKQDEHERSKDGLMRAMELHDRVPVTDEKIEEVDNDHYRAHNIVHTLQKHLEKLSRHSIAHNGDGSYLDSIKDSLRDIHDHIDDHHRSMTEGMEGRNQEWTRRGRPRYLPKDWEDEE